MVRGYKHPKYGPQMALSRKVINTNVGRIVRAWKWAVSQELIPSTAWEALRTVPGLRHGRCEARESAPVEPVALDVIEKTLPHVNRHVQALVRLQVLAGMRSGEAVQLRSSDLDTSGPAWFYRPTTHQTQHFGRQRVIALGPKAQAVLVPFLRFRCPGCGPEGFPAVIGWTGRLCGPWYDREEERKAALQDSAGGPVQQPAPAPLVRPLAEERYLFSPWVAREEHYAALRAVRKTPVQPSQRCRRKRKPQHLPGQRYTSTSYARAIATACEDHGIQHWHPHQLRHTHATEVRRLFGLEAAQVALGHSRANVTQVYAERDLGLATRGRGDRERSMERRERSG
jgi:integrase